MTATAMPVLTKVADREEESSTPNVNPDSQQIVVVSLADPQKRTLAVSPEYIHVAKDATVSIKWLLDQESFTNRDAFFDCPGITFFGEDPTGLDWTRNLSAITVSWNNTDPNRHKQSFFYRVHVLDSQDRIYTTDPIVHNDPPSNTEG